MCPYSCNALLTATVVLQLASVHVAVQAAEVENKPIGQTSVSEGAAPLQLSEDQKKEIIEGVVGVHNQLPKPPEYKPEQNAKVPATLHLSAFSSDLRTRIPTLKGYMYAHFGSEIAIVDPLKLTTALVLPLPENLSTNELKPNANEAGLNKVGGLADLSKEQKQKIYASLTSQTETTGSSASATAQSLQPGVTVLAGSETPANVTLIAIPANVAAEIPQLSGLEFAKLEDGRLLLADPKNRKIAGLITEDEGRGQKASRRAPLIPFAIWKKVVTLVPTRDLGQSANSDRRRRAA